METAAQIVAKETNIKITRLRNIYIDIYFPWCNLIVVTYRSTFYLTKLYSLNRRATNSQCASRWSHVVLEMFINTATTKGCSNNRTNYPPNLIPRSWAPIRVAVRDTPRDRDRLPWVKSAAGDNRRGRPVGLTEVIAIEGRLIGPGPIREKKRACWSLGLIQAGNELSRSPLRERSAFSTRTAGCSRPRSCESLQAT